MTEPIPVDTSGDGVADLYAYDVNHDGLADVYGFDPNQDGVNEVWATDFDHDGNPENVFFDRNQDGIDDATQNGQGLGYVGGNQFHGDDGIDQAPINDTWI